MAGPRPGIGAAARAEGPPEGCRSGVKAPQLSKGLRRAPEIGVKEGNGVTQRQL